ncbi:uncharacterized protein VTP21DRAFT_3455 [Calcarisporiella thermophila]|uniref:uncharacterized protein n=1 Tax=Calcarisporiella thermophila TaxID=911321 RepID=UPI003743ACEC
MNRYGPTGGLLNRGAMNPAQPPNRLPPQIGNTSGLPPMNSTLNGQRGLAGSPMMPRMVNGRIGSNAPSWNFQTSSLPSQQSRPSLSSPFGPGTTNSQGEVLDMSEFPALGSTSAPGGAGNAGGNGTTTGMNYASTASDGRPSHHQSSQLSIDDFPALPGARSPGSQQQGQQGQSQPQTPSAIGQGTMQNGIMGFGISQQHRQVQQQSQQQPQQQQAPPGQQQTQQQGQQARVGSISAPTQQETKSYATKAGQLSAGSATGSQQDPSSQPSADKQFGAQGLLSLIRITDPDMSALTVGCDLTNLGLQLNSSEPLYSGFVVPWADKQNVNSLQIEPLYSLPSCYNVQTPPPAHTKMASFSDETLFYIFYSMPRDMLQEAAAQELYNRNWRYHKDLRLWLTRKQGQEPYVKTQAFERGLFIFFDPATWEKVEKEYVLVYDALESRVSTSTAGVGGLGAFPSLAGGVGSLGATGLVGGGAIGGQGMQGGSGMGMMGHGSASSTGGAGMGARGLLHPALSATALQ